jgi:hypothetical protein
MTTDYLGVVSYYGAGQRTQLVEYFTIVAGSAQVGEILVAFQSAQASLRRQKPPSRGTLWLDERELALLARFFSAEKVLHLAPSQ